MTKKEVTVEEKLRALYSLQLIDSQIDELENVRGELPLEVQDLEDEIAGLQNRLEKLSAESEHFTNEVATKKHSIEEAKALIKKYTEQQKNVRNNREFNSISKEIEYQELEIQLAEKRIKEHKAQLEYKKQTISEIQKQIETKKSHLKHKKDELDSILAETQKEETFLAEKAQEIAKDIEPRLLQAYRRIRGSVANKMAVVSVERGASGGSFFVIPPQVQMEIASRKKIITDEHSGRILVDPALAEEERQKIEELLKTL